MLPRRGKAPPAKPAAVALGAYASSLITINHPEPGYGLRCTYASRGWHPTSYGSLPGGEGLRRMVDRLTQQGPTVRADAGDLAVPGALAALSGGVAGFVAAADLATDVGVVGNHEFEWGTEHLLVHARKAGFPLMCANAPEVGLPPTALLETACQVLRQKTSLPKTPVDPGQGVKSSRGELG